MILLLVAALGLMVWVWRSAWERYVASALTATATFGSASIPFGDSVELTLAVRNPARFPAPLVTCEIELPKGLSTVQPDPSDPDGVVEATASRLSFSIALRSREEVHLHYTLYGVRRGHHRLISCTMTVSNGFTRGQRYVKVPVDGAVVVHPPKRTTELPNRARRRVGQVSTLRKLFPTSQDWVDLRPYQMGDPLRDVHWLTSARRGELTVLERATSVANHAVVVASTQISQEFWASDERVGEAVIALTYAVLLGLLQDGLHLSVYTNLATRRVAGGSGSRRLITMDGHANPKVVFRLGHALGSLPVYPHVPLARVLSEVYSDVPEPSRIYVVTGFTDVDAERQLARLKSAGHEVQVVKVNPRASTETTTEQAVAP